MPEREEVMWRAAFRDIHLQGCYSLPLLIGVNTKETKRPRLGFSMHKNMYLSYSILATHVKSDPI